MNYLVKFTKNYRLGKLQTVDLYSITFTSVDDDRFLQSLSEIIEIVESYAIIAKETISVGTYTMVYEYTITDVEDGKMDEELARFCETSDATYNCEHFHVFEH